jgi:SAM-dependent methyltransferase
MSSIRSYYDTLAATYDRERFGNSYGRYVDAMERSVLDEWLRGTDPAEVVDIACGTGRLLDYAKTGVDLSRAMLRKAEMKWQDRRLVEADATSTRLPDAGFTAVICFHLLMHLDAAACSAVLREAARIVRPGGRIILDIPSKPRRALSRRPPSGWHGDTAATLDEVDAWSGDAWRLRRSRGILFVPIHRLPSTLRRGVSPADALIGRTPLARWSSYYLCELERV